MRSGSAEPIQRECSHPFIVKLHSTFQQHRKLYYILEYCPGGELFGLIRRLKRFS
jgi:serine/threonine protein kinase